MGIRCGQCGCKSCRCCRTCGSPTCSCPRTLKQQIQDLKDARKVLEEELDNIDRQLTELKLMFD
jgi:hypothetical protein